MHLRNNSREKKLYQKFDFRFADNDTDSELGMCGGGNGGGINDDTSSTSSEKYERDVGVLNHWLAKKHIII